MTAVPARFVQATAPARGIILSSPHASPPLFEAGACAKEAKREGERAGAWNPFGSFAKADAGVGGEGVAGSRRTCDTCVAMLLQFLYFCTRKAVYVSSYYYYM